MSLIALMESARETVSLPRFGFCFVLFVVVFLSHARDCTKFTLYDLTDFLPREGESVPHLNN